MMFKGKKLFDASFDKYAKRYDEIRPQYPIELFEKVFKDTKLQKNMEVLEIGAGSGIATKELVKTGAKIIAIEPGENLSKILELNFKTNKNVTVITDTFEDANIDLNKFDLIVSATSFHWLKGEESLEKFKRTEILLKDEGYLILFWNSFCRYEGDLIAKIDKIYEEELSDIYSSEKNVNLKVLKKILQREKEILENEYFYIEELKRYRTDYTYDAERYVDLLNTYPKIINLDETRKKDFFKKIHNVIKNNGDLITMPVITSLYVLKKQKNFYKM